jgi:outer membrane protein TolC
MNRRLHKACVILIAIAILSTGCHPIQPFYFHEKGDLSNYIDRATEIEYPDVDQERLAEVNEAAEPYTAQNPPDPNNTWALPLEEAVRLTMVNSKVLRLIGTAGRVNSVNPPAVSDGLLRTTTESQVNSIYDPAIQESSPFAGQIGVEAALAAYDAQLEISTIWQKNDRLQNSNNGNVFAPAFVQDRNDTSFEIFKRLSSGGRAFVRNDTVYDQNTQGFRLLPSDWDTSFAVGITQPLLRDFGTQISRITGPRTFTSGSGLTINDRARLAGERFNGVMIARINTDQRLLDFECAIRDMVSNVETSYWELYFAYRNLDAVISGRDSALATWRTVHAKFVVGAKDGEKEKEAQAREQYFLFKAQVQRGLWTLYAAENRLRYIMGLTATDGRVIRPSDEPTTAMVSFDWNEIHCEALARSCELRREKWEIKRRELELIATRNLLLPTLDAHAVYRFRGWGDDLINSGRTITVPSGDAFSNLTSGDHQEWQLGFRFSMPIGFRKELSAVRHQQLLLTKEKAVLRDKELELSHQLSDAYRELDVTYHLMQTNFNRRIAAKDQVDAVEVALDAGTVTLDLLLDAQRRLADAESAFFRSLVDYNLSIRNVHLRKGSLLEYNNVTLAEGPWPAKAYYDAQGQARKRGAGHYMNYGFTRPDVISRGPVRQHIGNRSERIDGEPVEASPEEIPAPPAGRGSGSGAKSVLQQANATAQNGVDRSRYSWNLKPQSDSTVAETKHAGSQSRSTQNDDAASATAADAETVGYAAEPARAQR